MNPTMHATFVGSNPEHIDQEAHEAQYERVARIMADGIWRSKRELHSAVTTDGEGDMPLDSMMRYLRGMRERGWVVEKDWRLAFRAEPAGWVYHAVRREPPVWRQRRLL